MSIVREIMEHLSCDRELAYEIYFNMDIDFSECEQFEFESAIDQAYGMLTHQVNL